MQKVAVYKVAARKVKAHKVSATKIQCAKLQREKLQFTKSQHTISLKVRAHNFPARKAAAHNFFMACKVRAHAILARNFAGQIFFYKEKNFTSKFLKYILAGVCAINIFIKVWKMAVAKEIGNHYAGC